MVDNAYEYYICFSVLGLHLLIMTPLMIYFYNKYIKYSNMIIIQKRHPISVKLIYYGSLFAIIIERTSLSLSYLDITLDDYIPEFNTFLYKISIHSLAWLGMIEYLYLCLCIFNITIYVSI